MDSYCRTEGTQTSVSGVDVRPENQDRGFTEEKYTVSGDDLTEFVERFKEKDDVKMATKEGMMRQFLFGRERPFEALGINNRSRITKRRDNKSRKYAVIHIPV
jgi:hypothetical protein